VRFDIALLIAAGRAGVAPQAIEQLAERLDRHLAVVVVVDLDHRRVATCAQAFDLVDAEQPVVGDLTVAQVVLLTKVAEQPASTP